MRLLITLKRRQFCYKCYVTLPLFASSMRKVSLSNFHNLLIKMSNDVFTTFSLFRCQSAAHNSSTHIQAMRALKSYHFSAPWATQRNPLQWDKHRKTKQKGLSSIIDWQFYTLRWRGSRSLKTIQAKEIHSSFPSLTVLCLIFLKRSICSGVL